MTLKILSKRGRTAEKPSKPRKDFPLFPHDSGQWAKKVKGKLHYFGTWDDPVAAEAAWERDKLAILEGRDPNRATPGDSIGWLCDAFMESKNLQLERGELSKRAFNDYWAACKAVAKHFGHSRTLRSLHANDFDRYRNSLSDTWGPVTINNHLRLVRVIFKYANDIEATEREIRFRRGLKGVPVATVRKHDAKQPAKEFTAAEIHSLLDSAATPMRAFILLGINCGYGTMDIARLKTADVDFSRSWLGEPRGKTGVSRGAWLWPETVEALQDAIANRPPATNERHEPLAFLTRNRRPWATDGGTSHPLPTAFNKVKEAAGIIRDGVGHYALRHTFETIAGDVKDQPAVDYVMGHLDNSMAGTYREGIDPKRIEAVCKHVRAWWLKGKPKKQRASKASEAAKGKAHE